MSVRALSIQEEVCVSLTTTYVVYCVVAHVHPRIACEYAREHGTVDGKEGRREINP